MCVCVCVCVCACICAHVHASKRQNPHLGKAGIAGIPASYTQPGEVGGAAAAHVLCNRSAQMWQQIRTCKVHSLTIWAEVPTRRPILE